MPLPNDLSTILDRIKNGEQTEVDMATLRQLLSVDDAAQEGLRQRQIALQLGKYNVNIGQGQDIQIGDRIYVEWNDEAIQALIQVVRKQLPTPATGIPENLPRSGVVQFVGRERELETLHQQLQENERVAVSAIAGMGGIGKTELALQYALRYKPTYQGGICWLQARGVDVGTQIVQFGRSRLQLNPPEDLDLPDRVGFCWRNWQDGDVLAVFDDVTDYNAIKPYLPPVEPRFKVLLTTRLQLGSSVRQLFIDLLDEAAALELLMSLVGEDRIQQQLEDAKALCHWLGYLPLGLELVGRYLVQEPDLSLGEIRSRLHNEQLQQKALTRDENDPTWTSTAQQGVAAAFELSWKQLNEAAQQLGCLLSLFALAPIPWSLVEQVIEACLSRPQPVNIWAKLLRFLQFIRNGNRQQPAPWLHLQVATALEDARGLLHHFNLLQRTGENTYRLHQLLRIFFKTKLEQSDWTNQFKEAFCQTMAGVAQQVPNAPIREQIMTVAPAIPHVTEAAITLTNWLRDEDLIEPFGSLARYYEAQAAYPQAVFWCEQCLSTARNRLGENHLAVAESLHNLAIIYMNQGRYVEAEPLYVRSLELSQRLLGKKHREIANILHDLAGLYVKQGRYGEAETLLIRAMYLGGRYLPLEQANILDYLAAVYHEQGRYEKAEQIYMLLLEVNRLSMRKEDLYTANILSNLASLYYRQKRHNEAEPLCLQALELTKRLLGEEHPQVAPSLELLALIYEAQGRGAEAEPLYVQALELRKRWLGEEHPDVAINLQNLAELYANQGRYTEAEPLLLQALELDKHLLGENHPDTVLALISLAQFYAFQGRYAEAEPLLVKALSLSKHLLQETQLAGSSLDQIIERYRKLEDFYMSQERYAEAERLLLPALELEKHLFGDENAAIASSLNRLATAYILQKRFTEAEPLLLRVLELRKHLPREDPTVAADLSNLALIYSSQERYAEAESLLLQALELRKRLLGKDHPDIANSLNNLAVFYISQERYTEAEPLLVQALMIAESHLGSDHPNTIQFRENLERLRSQQS